MQHNRTILALAAAAALVTGACGIGAGEAADDRTDAPRAAATGATSEDGGDVGSSQVTIRSFIFEPTPLEVAVGTTVTWSNEDKILHTATSGTPDAPTDVFDIEMAEVGTSGEFTFEESGTYDYFCSRHTSMRGQIVVS